jgi:xanthine dehydrogenase YagS FAD-binding subunit
MKPFAYVTAQTAASAVELVRDQGRFLAGGMDLLGELKEGVAEPKLLVNVKTVPGLHGIEAGPERWTIGANVTLTELADHTALRQALPAVAEAADEVGSPQIRNVGTLGGNLAQHSRCWYYRHRDVRCAKKGGGRCFARGGQNKYHSLFAQARCLSPCVSNLAIALSALNAAVVVQRGAKTATLSLAELYQAAWDSAQPHNSLQADDLILRVEVPAAAGLRSAYLQVSEKREFDWALVSCAASARIDGGKARDVRIALGCVAPIPWQAREANAFLEGKELNEANAARAAELLLKGATAREHNGFKIPIAQALVRRTLAKLA